MYSCCALGDDPHTPKLAPQLALRRVIGTRQQAVCSGVALQRASGKVSVQRIYACRADRLPRPLAQFDFINVHEFHATNCTTRLQCVAPSSLSTLKVDSSLNPPACRYFWLYLLFAKSVAVYIADIYTAIALLASNRWSGSILQSAAAEGSSKSATVLEVPFSIVRSWATSAEGGG